MHAGIANPRWRGKCFHDFYAVHIGNTSRLLREFHRTDTVGCNYLSLPLIPASGTQVLIYLVADRKATFNCPLERIVLIAWLRETSLLLELHSPQKSTINVIVPTGRVKNCSVKRLSAHTSISACLVKINSPVIYTTLSCMYVFLTIAQSHGVYG